ncbi:hypothetical protein BST81_11945 [Leptolyngbya sp. 'hensonii']|uniref:tetratricopeptide repeat protein n=1 Tax=Leptolyngbya sp. 'hensonii' TaxID=1922337 RepID=UPI00095034D6|nr:tetratricopeptide repeat protein [Leptolyngbya sp. 'hensonii']OLP17779.1 hypothetical protein BST81_11945 [Leptolyngbya sp. 'hensonii']
MDIGGSLPVLYLSLLLVLLSAAAFFIVRQAIQTRKIEGTLSRLEGKLAKEKGTAQEYYELGGIYLQKKLFSQAVKQFERALKAPTLETVESAPIYNALGFAYFAQEQYDIAIRQYKEALKIKPEYVTALNNLGHAYERKQLIPSAIETYEQVLNLEPQNGVAKRRLEALQKRLVPSS